VKTRATWNVERWSAAFRVVLVRKHWSHRKSNSAATSSAERGTPEIGPRYPVSETFLRPDSSQFRLNSSPVPSQFCLDSSPIPPRFCPDSASMPSQFCRLNFTLLYGINPLPSYFHWGICFSKTWSNFCFNWYDSISNVQIVALIQLFSQSNRIMFHIFKSSKNGLANALASQWENGRFGSFITPFILSKTHYIKTLFIRCY